MGGSVMHISWGAVVGGVMLILLGLYLSLYQVLAPRVGDPFGKAIVAASSVEFLNWVRLLGILIAVRGVYVIGSSLVPRATLAGQVVRVGGEVLSALAIPLLLWLREQAEQVPIVSLRDGQVHVTFASGGVAQTVRLALNILIALIVVGIAASVIQMLTGQGPGQATTS
jgi:hypothetical protein